MENRKCTVHSLSEGCWNGNKSRVLMVRTDVEPCKRTGSFTFSFALKESTSQNKYYTQHANRESVHEPHRRLFWCRLHSQPDGRLPQIETQSRSEMAGKRTETKTGQKLIPKLLLCISKPGNQDHKEKTDGAYCLFIGLIICWPGCLSRPLNYLQVCVSRRRRAGSQTLQASCEQPFLWNGLLSPDCLWSSPLSSARPSRSTSAVQKN